jgi:Tfp pilus assembly protein PilO
MNVVVAFFARLSWLRVLLGCLLSGGAYYALLYNDGTAKLAVLQTTENQQRDAANSLKATQTAVANADKFEREVKDLSEQFTHIVTIMPEKLNMAELTATVMEIALKSGVRLLKTEPKPSSVKTEFYDSIGLGLSIEGNFSQIAMFLSMLSRVPRLMTFDHATLENAGDIDPETPKLAFKTTLIGYRYVPDVVADPKATPKPAPPTPPAATGFDVKPTSGRRVARADAVNATGCLDVR